jgi:hypothetical protein
MYYLPPPPCMLRIPVSHPPWPVTLTIFGEAYKVCSSCLCSFPHLSDKSFPLDTNLLLCISFSNTACVLSLGWKTSFHLHKKNSMRDYSFIQVSVEPMLNPSTSSLQEVRYVRFHRHLMKDLRGKSEFQHSADTDRHVSNSTAFNIFKWIYNSA